MDAEEATYWHIRTTRSALDAMEEAMNDPHSDTPIAHSLHMIDRIGFVEEHMEGLAFEYDRYWKERLDPKRAAEAPAVEEFRVGAEGRERPMGSGRADREVEGE